MSPRATRDLTVDVTVDAPVGEVWKALATGEGLRRWFPFDARVDARTGGEIWLSWGPGMEGAGPLALVEPGKRLVWREPRPEEDGEPVEIAVEFQVEARGERTLVRIVQSGFGTSSSWDAEIDSVSRGWLVYIRQLRFTLERHRGADRRVVYAESKVNAPAAEIWRRVFSPAGFGGAGSDVAGREGGTLDLRTEDGDRLSGEVHVWNPPKDLAMVIGDWNDAHLWVEIAPAPTAKVAKFTLSLYGVDDATADGIAQRCTERWNHLFADVART